MRSRVRTPSRPPQWSEIEFVDDLVVVVLTRLLNNCLPVAQVALRALRAGRNNLDAAWQYLENLRQRKVCVFEYVCVCM